MADNYSGVTVSAVLPTDGWVPMFAQAPNITSRHIPSANFDDVQAAGRGNFELTVTVQLQSSSDLSTLLSMVGTTLRTLVLYGVTYANTALIKVANVKQRGIAAGGGYYRADCTFNYAGT